METVIFNLVNNWANTYLKGSEEQARTLFLQYKYNDKASNCVNPVALPEGINWDNYIIDTKLEKYEMINNGVYEIYFRLELNMQFEGSITNCDFMKYLVYAKFEDSELKISKIKELACYPWELDKFKICESKFGKVYIAPNLYVNFDNFLQIIDNAFLNLSRMFNNSYLNNLSIVVFPSSQSLCEFLEITIDWGELGGKAKGNYIFIVYHNSELCRRTVQHEIAHIALERAVECYTKQYFIYPCLNEALAEMASLSFDYDDVIKMYKSILEVDELSINNLEELVIQTAEERSKQILIAVSLLHYIQSIHRNEGVLNFIIKSALNISLAHAIKVEFGYDLIAFEEQWRRFVKEKVNHGADVLL